MFGMFYKKNQLTGCTSIYHQHIFIIFIETSQTIFTNLIEVKLSGFNMSKILILLINH